jgi:site-specific DNA-methyltransferase (adenine-specific)
LWPGGCRGWFAAFTSHDLIPAWEDAFRLAERVAFAPVPVIQKRLRVCGDGPSSWAVYLMVCRPRGGGFNKWATLPGSYDAGIDRRGVIGGKPLSLMRAIVGDYTNPGDAVVDPCAGGATTLIAAAELGCKAIGAEIDPDTYAKAQKRIARGYTPMPHPRAHKSKGKPKQGALW